MAGIGSLAGVPAPIGAQFENTVSNVASNAEISETIAQTVQLPINAGTDGKIETFSIGSLLSDASKTIEIKAEIVPRANLVPDKSGGAWTVNDVSSAGFPMDATFKPAPGASLGQFL